MNRQIIVTPSGERLVVLPEAEYEALLDAAEATGDTADIAAFDRAVASDPEFFPSAFVDKLLDEPYSLRTCREYRGLSVYELAAKTGMSASYLGELESGVKRGNLEELTKIAEVLGMELDLIE